MLKKLSKSQQKQRKSLGTSWKLWLFKRTLIRPCAGILCTSCSASRGENPDVLWLAQMHMAGRKQCPFDHVICHDWQFGVELSTPTTMNLVGKFQGQCCKIWVPNFSEIPIKLEFEFNVFSRPVSVSRNFPLVTRWVFHLVLPVFDPKTTSKCCIPRHHIDPEIENNTTVFRKGGFLFTPILIKQVRNQATVNENSMSSDHRDLIFNSHAANSCFKLTFCECRIILNSRSILSVPFWSLHENYFVWALHRFCKLQNLLSFKTDQLLWNMALFDSLNCRGENWICPVNGEVHYLSTHTPFWHDQLISHDETHVCSVTVDSINPDCCYQCQIVSIRINYKDGAIKSRSCKNNRWHVFSSNKRFLSLSWHVEMCNVSFPLWSSAQFENILRISPSTRRLNSTMSWLKLLHPPWTQRIKVEMLYSPFLPWLFTTPETRREVLDSCWIPDEPPKDVDGRNSDDSDSRNLQWLCFSPWDCSDVC